MLNEATWGCTNALCFRVEPEVSIYEGFCVCVFCLFGQGDLGIVRCHTSCLLLIVVIEKKKRRNWSMLEKRRKKSTNVCDYLWYMIYFYLLVCNRTRSWEGGWRKVRDHSIWRDHSISFFFFFFSKKRKCEHRAKVPAGDLPRDFFSCSSLRVSTEIS